MSITLGPGIKLEAGITLGQGSTVYEQFPNSGFELGTLYWTIVNQIIHFNGVSTLAGWPTPTDPNPTQYGVGDIGTFITTPSLSTTLDTIDKPLSGQTQSMHLNMGTPVNGELTSPYAAKYGPALCSEFAVNFNAGDQLAFDWRGEAGADAFSIFAYLLEINTGNCITALRAWGPNDTYSSLWTNEVVTVNTSGQYKFVFVCGSWDSTGGQVIGANGLVDNILRIT